MNKEIKARWLKALRSDKYKQGAGQLRNKNDEFCCLGVYIDVLGAEWIWDAGCQRYDPSEGFDTPDGNEYVHPDLLERDMQFRLAAKNDRGDSFSEIADYIERRL